MVDNLLFKIRTTNLEYFAVNYLRTHNSYLSFTKVIVTIELSNKSVLRNKIDRRSNKRSISFLQNGY